MGQGQGSPWWSVDPGEWPLHWSSCHSSDKSFPTWPLQCEVKSPEDWRILSHYRDMSASRYVCLWVSPVSLYCLHSDDCWAHQALADCGVTEWGGGVTWAWPEAVVWIGAARSSMWTWSISLRQKLILFLLHHQIDQLISATINSPLWSQGI